MVEIVRIGSASIAVRDDLAPRVVAVCLRCRGFGEVCKTDCICFNPTRWAGHQIVCPACQGKGLYREGTPAGASQDGQG